MWQESPILIEFIFKHQDQILLQTNLKLVKILKFVKRIKLELEKHIQYLLKLLELFK